MKDFDVTLRIRNNRLKQRREELGMNQRELADAAGIDPTLYGEFEAMKKSPFSRKDGSWRETVLRLAAFHGVEPCELFPESVLSVERAEVVRKVDKEDVYPLLSDHQQRALLSPEDLAAEQQRKQAVQVALKTLAPIDQRVLELRFGFLDDDERTLREIGDHLGGRSVERMRQRQDGAFRELAHKNRLGWLREKADK